MKISIASVLHREYINLRLNNFLPIEFSRKNIIHGFYENRNTFGNTKVATQKIYSSYNSEDLKFLTADITCWLKGVTETTIDEIIGGQIYRVA